MSFEPRINEYDNTVELVGMAKLIALPSQKEFTYTNANNEEKKYRLGTIEIVTPSGEVTQSVTQIHQRNLELMQESGMEFAIGTSYLTTLRSVQGEDGKPRIFASTSHLVASIMSAEATNELDAMMKAFADVNNNNQDHEEEVVVDEDEA